MSDKFVISDGYIGDVSEDITRVQDALCGNLQKRLHVMVENPGIQQAEEDSFGIHSAIIQATGVATYTVKVTLHNLAMTIFSDYIVADPILTGSEINPMISYDFTQSESFWQGYVILTREHVYSTPGTWRDGYPEGSPVQGDNLKDTIQLALVLSDSPINDASHITLYKINILPTTYAILNDYRVEQSMALRRVTDTSQLPVVTNIQLQSISHKGTLIESRGVRGDLVFNTRSPHTNLMANEYMLRITWNSVYSDSNVWAYDVRVFPQSGASQTPISTMPMTYLVMGESGSTGHEILVPAAEGVKYQVKIRAIEKQHPRLAAEWSKAQFIVLGTDLLDGIPEPPALVVQRLYQDPSIISVQITVTEEPPRPFMVQLFQRSGTKSSTPAESSIVVYEGDPGQVQLVIGQDENPEYRARVVGPGGVSSTPTDWTPVPIDPIGPGNLYYAEKLQIAIPIMAKIVIDSSVTASGYSYCAEFYPPTPGCYVSDMSFVGTGCYYYHDISICTPELFTEDFWFQVEPSSYPITADFSGGTIPTSQKSRLFWGDEGSDVFDIYDYYSDGFGGGPWATGFGVITCSNYHRYWETATNNDNYVSTQGFSATEKLRVMIRFDDTSYTAGDDLMVIVTGTLFLTLQMAEV